MKMQEKVTLCLGKLSQLDLKEDFFDALICHRMIHLLPLGAEIQFVQSITRIMRKGGLIAISARDRRDYDPCTMSMVGNGQAEYKSPDRKGHFISFWDEDRFKAIFSDSFEILRYEQSTEVESERLGGVASITTMVARKL